MLRGLIIKLRSFYILYIKDQRYKNTISTLKMYEVYFEEELPKLQRIRGSQ